MNNNKKAKRCIDCGSELQKSSGSEVVVCEECLRRIKRQFWSSINIENERKKLKKRASSNLRINYLRN
jgi:ribosomal protein L37AE/L43A